MKHPVLLASLALVTFSAASACVGDEPGSGATSDAGPGVTPMVEGGIPPATKAPTAPTDVTAVADVPHGATVSFKPPIEGAPITSYTVHTTPGGTTKDLAPTATSVVLSDLTVGQTYTFTLSATNAVGPGPESAPTVPVTIVDAPSVPKGMSACGGDAQAYVYVPAAVGATSYNVYTSTTAGGAKPGATKLNVPAAGRVAVPSLVNGTPYFVAVTALLGSVESAPSAEVKVTPKAFKAIGDVLFAASLLNSSVEMYDAYSTLVGAAAVPSRKLIGAATKMNQPTIGSVQVVKSAGELYVSSAQSSRIDVFEDAASLNGNIAPGRSLSGASTTLSAPSGIVVDETRNVLYVADGGSILRFDDACNVTGDTAPAAVIMPSGTYATYSREMALDAKNDRLYVANAADVVVFDAVSSKSGAVAPTKRFTVGTNAGGRHGVSYDGTSDVLYVASRDESQPGTAFTGLIWSFTAASNLPSGAVTPAQTVLSGDTRNAMDVLVVNNRLYLLTDSATLVTRWDDAKNAANTATVHTVAEPGVFYSSIAYVP